MRQGLKFKYLRERELHTYIYLDYVRVEFLFKKEGEEEMARQVKFQETHSHTLYLNTNPCEISLKRKFSNTW